MAARRNWIGRGIDRVAGSADPSVRGGSTARGSRRLVRSDRPFLAGHSSQAMTFPSSAIRDDPAPACPPVAGTGPRDPGRAGCYTGAFLAILLVGIAVRAALIAFGRTTVLDGFYLAAAFRLGEGDRPYR